MGSRGSLRVSNLRGPVDGPSALLFHPCIRPSSSLFLESWGQYLTDILLV